MPRSPDRSNQKSRTRAAILAGARELMAAGKPVTVTAAAERGGVSKATAYRYFSDPGLLAAEAGLAIHVLTSAEVFAGATTPRARAVAVSRYFLDLALDHEAAFRQFLARTMDAWAVDPARTTRGARRVDMFHEALAGLDPPLPSDRHAALIRALTAATGTEAMIALLDIARADSASARAAVTEIAEAILVRFLGPEPGDETFGQVTHRAPAT